MPFPEFDPVLIHLGPLPIRWYALAYVAGIVLGWVYAARILKSDRVWAPGKPPIAGPQLDDLILWITLGIILGGRFGYALFYKPVMFAQLFTGANLGERLELFQLWTGGMSFHGGMLGCTLAVLIYAWRTKASALSIGDMALAAAPIGLFFGRMANFVNGELWGRTTDVPWAIRFCNARIEQMYGFCPAGNEPRHPSQLYEAGLEGVLLFAILWVAIWKLNAQLCLTFGPPFSPMPGIPQTVKSTVITSPALLPGLSAGERCTAPTLLSGKVAA